MANMPNNPAGRLFAIIRHLQAVRKERNMATDEAWAVVFDVDPQNNGLLLDRIGKCLQLGNEISEKIKNLSINQQLFLKDIDQIGTAFRQMNLQQDINTTLSKIKPESIRGLEYCDHELSKNCPEHVIPADDLSKIHDEICTLFEEVVQSDIDDYLRNYILDKLDLLRQAIELYEINGSGPIKKALYEVTGNIILSQDNLKDKDSKNIGKKFGRILILLYLATQIINNVAQLPDSISKILPDTTISAEEIIDTQDVDIEND